jgi:hypothetical protein
MLAFSMDHSVNRPFPLSGRARRLVADLPPDLSVEALCEHAPDLLDRLASCWHDPSMLERAFNESLFRDSRRVGPLPFAALTELAALKLHAASCRHGWHPSVWDEALGCF